MLISAFTNSITLPLSIHFDATTSKFSVTVTPKRGSKF